MPTVRSAATLTAGFNKRFAQPGTVDLSASGEVVFPSDPDSSLGSVHAAGVRSFSAPGKLQYVKALDHFLVLGETVQAGEYVELPEYDARFLVNIGRAEFASAADVAAAQKAGK